MLRFPFAISLVLALALAGAACNEKPGALDGNEPGSSAPAVAGLDALRLFADALGKDTYRLVYEITGSDSRKGDVSATLSLAADPPRQAFGIAGEFEGERAAFTLINDGQSSYVCIQAGGPGRCLKGQSLATATIPMPALLDVESLLGRISADTDARVRPAPDQRIAGQEGQCWEIEGAEGEGAFCTARSDGALLLLEGDFDGASFKMKATEIGRPSGKDFEPPYRVVEFES
ncbi:MAG: hypothetical protein HS107_06830 [Thermoflexaceae bacterium]|nr:hypothetical protein [Thermoflexaceae bacterium]